MNTKAKKRHEDLEYIRSWFNYPGQPHVATLDGRGWLTFARPGSSTYRVDFHCHGGWLLVCGDIGEAVFQWSQIVTFKWIASCDFEYFLGKCQASEVGREFYQWDGDVMREVLDDHLREMGGPSRIEKAMEAGAHDAVGNEQEWIAWCHHNYELLGDDASEWLSNGRVPHIRARGMFEGLKLAVAQLEAVPAAS